MTSWSIQQVAKIAGTTSRALRHYGEIGLLNPSSIAHNGYRYYDEQSLLRLQRILLLRDLGLGLPQIAEVLDREVPETLALENHLAWLTQEQDRLARQVASVYTTLNALRGGEELMAEKMFDGFDHTHYKDEVEQRWGTKAYVDSDNWWRSKSKDEQATWKQRLADLNNDWISAAEAGMKPEGAEAQALAERHVQWLRATPGAPSDTKAYVMGLADMYVADDRFAANYATASGGVAGAEFVRDALHVYANRHL
ncbi:TipAS antibiotic-recognition domain-containing protein [Microbacterium sp. NPDC076911]|uniref:MerR family transcriptional regulator n=1 Tax=Microbacterium sp. NPDC076911 TaxID=3154958 RepID=UPI0034474A45